MIKKLNTKHRKIMALILDGKTKREVQEVVPISDPHYYQVVNSDIFQSEMNKMQIEIQRETIRMIAYKEVDPVRQMLKQGSLEAVRTHLGIISKKKPEDSDKIKQTSASDILDRAGYAGQKVGIDNRQQNIVHIEGKRAEVLERALNDLSEEAIDEPGADKQHEKVSSQ